MKKRFRLFIQLLININMDKVLAVYIVFYIITALIIKLVEPTIDTFGDAVWYCFVSCSTIGFGDLVAVTLIGRLLTAALYIYKVFVIALLTALFTQFMIELIKLRMKESVADLMDKLEHLDELSHDELRELSTQIKKNRSKQ